MVASPRNQIQKGPLRGALLFLRRWRIRFSQSVSLRKRRWLDGRRPRAEADASVRVSENNMTRGAF